MLTGSCWMIDTTKARKSMEIIINQSSPTFRIFSLGNLRWTSVGKFLTERSSMDFFANFRIFLWAIFDGHRLGNVSRSDLRWTSSPTSEFFLWAILDGHRLGNFSRSDLRWTSSPTSEFFSGQPSTDIGLEITRGAIFDGLLWAIFDGRWLGDIFSLSDPRAPRGEVCKRYLIFISLTDPAGSKCRRIESISISITGVLAYHWCKRQASQVGSRQYSQQDLQQGDHFPQGGSKYNLLHLPCFARPHALICCACDPFWLYCAACCCRSARRSDSRGTYKGEI